jgi:hypothetical protein
MAPKKRTIKEIITGKQDDQPVELVQEQPTDDQPTPAVKPKRKVSPQQAEHLKKSRASRSIVNQKKKDAYEKLQKLQQYGVSYDDVIQHLENASDSSEDDEPEPRQQTRQVSFQQIDW